VTLATRNPGAAILSVDLARVHRGGTRARPHGRRHECHVPAGRSRCLALRAAKLRPRFVCFVLEHLPRPSEALAALRGVIRPGGTITVIEGDHGSTYFHPESAYARRASA
jgi:hypothetical protein